METLEILVRDLVSKLPRCSGPSAVDECSKLATFTRLDAAGDPWPACREHAKRGGMLGDEEPYPKSYAEPLRALVAHLKLPITIID